MTRKSRRPVGPRRPMVQINTQPNNTTCGPTCLHAVYAYYGDDISLARVIDEVPALATGGTLAVALANHALRRGYRARIYTFNLQVFDPTWFQSHADIAQKLTAQLGHKDDQRMRFATQAYLEYLSLGGELCFEPMAPGLIRRHLRREIPILTGLSATYLYQCAREFVDERGLDEYDDVRGEPTGHFVVISGYEPRKRSVLVADPLPSNPAFRRSYYSVGINELMGAIMLGMVTYDANLLVIEKSD